MENRPVNYESNGPPCAQEQVMDLNRVLLLLLCMAASEVPDVQASPIDFVCDYQARISMNRVEEMKSAMARCDGARQLPSAVPLPCAGMNMGAWRRASLQEKRAQVLADLKNLTEGLQRVKAQTKTPCQSTLLGQVEHSVTNYLKIVMDLDVLQDKGQGPDSACHRQDTLNLDKVLTQYNSLLRGKLEFFIMELGDRCQWKT